MLIPIQTLFFLSHFNIWSRLVIITLLITRLLTVGASLRQRAGMQYASGFEHGFPFDPHLHVMDAAQQAMIASPGIHLGAVKMSDATSPAAQLQTQRAVAWAQRSGQVRYVCTLQNAAMYVRASASLGVWFAYVDSAC